MLLNSWVRSFQKSIQSRRQSRRRGSNQQQWQAVQRDGSRMQATERLEERTLLTALVIDQQFADQNPGSINITNSTIDLDNDSNPEFDSIVIDSVVFDGVGGRGVNISLSDLDIDRIVVDGLEIGDPAAAQNQGSGLSISLNNVNLDAVVIDSSSIVSSFGGGVDINLTDVRMRELAIFDTLISGGLQAGLDINIAGVTRNTTIDELSISASNIDGLDVDSTGLRKPVAGAGLNATNNPSLNPLEIIAPDHGLQTGTEVVITGVNGLTAANTRDTITVVDENRFTLDNTDGTLSGAYTSGGTVTVLNQIDNFRISDSRIAGATGADGISITLIDTQADGMSILQNTEIDSIDISLTRTPIDGLTISDNVAIDADRPQVDAVRFNLNQSTLTNLVIDGNTIANTNGTSGGDGVVFNATDSNVYGTFTNNIVRNTFGNGLEFIATATPAFLAQNRGPLTFDFASLAAETTLTQAVNAGSVSILTADINSTTTVVPVANGSLFEVGQTIRVDAELMRVTLVAGNNLTVVRAQEGTRAVSHDSGARATSTTSLLRVVDGRAFQSQQTILIDSELMFIRSISGNTLTVSRAQQGTLALAHASGTRLRSVTSSRSGDRQSVSGNTFSGNAGAGVFANITTGGAINADFTRNTFNSNVTRAIDLTVTDTHALSGTLARGGIDRTSTTLNLVDASVFSAFNTPFDIMVEGERMTVNFIRGNSLNVTRGVGGTQASFHATNTTVTAASGDGLNVNIGGVTRADGNTFNSNTAGAIALTLQNEAAGAFSIENNVIVSSVQAGFGGGNTQSEADAVAISLLGSQSPNDATAVLRRSTINDNLIGARATTTLRNNITRTATVLSVVNASIFRVGEQVRLGPEVITVNSINTVTNTIAVTRGTGNPNNTFQIAHPANTLLVPGDGVTNGVSGGNQGRGIDVFFEEDTAVEDLQIRRNVIADNENDGVRIRREDDGVARTVNPVSGQTRAISIDGNTLLANAQNPTPEIFDPNLGSREVGAGIELVSLNGAFDQLDVSITSNTIVGHFNTGGGANPINDAIFLRAEADAQILADIIGNDLSYNQRNGVRLESREDSVSDQRDIGGRILDNTVTFNGGDGIDLSGHFGVANLLVIGQEGRGNNISSNLGNGVGIRRGGNVSIVGNQLTNNGETTNGSPIGTKRTSTLTRGIAAVDTGSGVYLADSDLQPNVEMAIDHNVIRDNVEFGIDLNVFSTVHTTIRDNEIIQNRNDGIEISGETHATILGNNVEANVGRGLDILVSGTIESNFLIGDGTNAGRNTFVSNRQEGVYYVSSAGIQAQNILTVPRTALSATGSVAARPNAVLNIDTNTIVDNGVDQNFSASGLLIRMGSADSGSDAFSHDVGLESSIGAPYNVQNSQLGVTPIAARTNASVTSNTFSGNFGDDVFVEAFVSTPDTGPDDGIWSDSTPLGFGVVRHADDPLSRLNMVFEGNTGEGLDVTQFAVGYSQNDGYFKSRDNVNDPDLGIPRIDGAAGTNVGPFSQARLRSITQIPSRMDQGIGPAGSNFGAGTALIPLAGVNPAYPTFSVTNIRNGSLAADGTEDIIVTAPGSNFFTGQTVQIAGVLAQTINGRFHQHTANGVFELTRIDFNTFSLNGTAGHGGPDYSSGGIAAVADGTTYLYPGVGPSTLRIAQGFDTAGSGAQNEFVSGDNFYDFTSAPWETWNPLPARSGIVTNVTNSGGVVITSPGHGLTDNRRIRIDGVTGAETVNGNGFIVDVLTTDTFRLVGAVIDDAYTGGGEWVTVDDSFIAPITPTFPLPEVIDVTPDPRSANTGIVTVTFSEPVRNLDIDDFILKRDGDIIDISGIPVIQNNAQSTEFILDLSSVTGVEGAYELTLDNTAPTARYVQLASNTLDGPVGVLTLNFSENVTGVDIGDFVLTRDGVALNLTEITNAQGVFGANLAVTQVSPSQYTVDLSSLTDPVGNYRFSLLAPRADSLVTPINNLNNTAGNPIVVRSRTPHGLSDGQVVRIDETLGTYTLAGGNVNNQSFRINVLDDFEFSLIGTQSNGTASAIGGIFQFDPGIIDESGHPYGRDGLPDDATIVWQRINTAPTADIIDIDPDPRNTAVDAITVQFSELVRIATVNVSDFELRRDDGEGLKNVPFSGTETITPLDPDPTGVFATRFVLGNLSPLTGPNPSTGEGAVFRIRLKNVDASRISDQSGSVLQADALDTWTLVTTGPRPSLNRSFGDRIQVPGNLVQLSFTATVNGVDTANAGTHFTLTRDTGNGPEVVPLVDGSGNPLTLTPSGLMYQLNLTPVTSDGGGNSVDGVYSLRLNRGTGITDVSTGEVLGVDALTTWIQDSLAPVATFSDIDPDPRVTDVGIVTVTFSEEVTDLSRLNAADDFVLTLDRGDGAGPQTVSLAGVRVRPINPVDVNGVPIVDAFTVATGVFASRYVIDLGPLTRNAGRYVLSMTDANGIIDRANNAFVDNQVVSQLISPITTTNGTTVQVADGTQFAPDQLIEIDNEQFIVRSVSGNTLTVRRGQHGTVRATHTNGSDVKLVVATVWSLVQKGQDTEVIDDTFPRNAVVPNPRRVDPAFGLPGNLRPNRAVGDAIETFFVDTTPPRVIDRVPGDPDLIVVDPNLRSTAVGIVSIEFTEPVVGFNLTDLKLTRNTGSGPLNVSLNGLTLVQESDSVYSIDLNLTTGAPGDYELSIDGTGSLIADLAGNPIQNGNISLATWRVENIGPSANLSITPVQRTTAANNIQLAFTKEVSVATVDIGDFRLQRNTGSGFVTVPITSGSITAASPVNGFDDTFTINLSADTAIEGTYRLTLVAADSGIVDAASIELGADSFVTWQLDNTRPTADIIDVTPDPRTTDAGIVNILFSEPVRNVDITDFTLTFDDDDGVVDPVTVPFGAVIARQESQRRYTIDLRTLTSADGTYTLSLATSDIVDLAGNTLSGPASDTWFKGNDVVPPTVVITDITPDPRATAVGLVTLTFSEDVRNVGIDDLRLTLDPDATAAADPALVSLAGLTVKRAPGSNSIYTIDLSSVTGTSGLYTLSVINNGTTPITDVSVNANVLSATLGGNVADRDQWRLQILDPSASFTTVTPDPRLRPVGVITLNFTTPVEGVDLSDLRLTRNGQQVSLRNATLTQSPIGPQQYFLDLSRATGAAGDYVLRLNANGSGIVQPDDGNPATVEAALTSDAVETWTTATQIVVNTFADGRDAVPGDGTVATSTGARTLRAAIMEANSLAGDDTIILSAGTYQLTIGGANEDFSATGDLDVRDTTGSLTIIGAGAGQTIIDARQLDRVFHILAGAELILEGVTLTGGRVTGSADGGGLRVDGGIVSVTSSVITGNTSQDDAGGINNTGNLTLDRVTVSKNTAARTGGGIRNAGQLTIIDSTIGGVFDPLNSIDNRNKAALDGGGIINLSTGVMNISNSTVSGNVSTGGVGGGVHTFGRAFLTNVTIASNSAGVDGGGLSVTGGFNEVRNTIIAGNNVSGTPDDVFNSNPAALDSLGNNLIQVNAGALVAFPVVNANNDLVNVNPLLDPLADNGGPTLTQSLQLGSPAINAGGAVSLVNDQRGITRNLNGVDIGAFEFGGFFVNSTIDSIDINPGDGIVADSFGRRTLRAAIMEANALPGANAIRLGNATYNLSLTEIDTTAPIADIIDVTPDPLAAAATTLNQVDEISFNFTEPVQGIDTTLTANNYFDLFFNDGVSGQVAVNLSTVTIRQDSSTQYTLEGLDTLLAADGLYTLYLRSAGITDFALVPNPVANDLNAPPHPLGTAVAAFDVFVRGADVFAPTAVLSQITTPRQTNPGAVSLTFNEPVTGVGLSTNPANFSLTFDDNDGIVDPVAVSLAGIAVQQVSFSQYLLDLTPVTAFNGLTDEGVYVLTFNGAATSIRDFASNVFVGNFTRTWTIAPDVTPPAADIVDISPDPRIDSAGVVTVQFTEAVTGVDLLDAETDFDLQFDVDGFGVGQTFTTVSLSGLAVTQVNDAQYTIDLSSVTGLEGEYRLVLTTDGAIEDVNGVDLAPALGGNEAADDFFIIGDRVSSVLAADAASFGDLDITADDLFIFGNGAGTSIINANQIDRVFDVFTGVSLSLQDLTVTGGQASGGNDGGGIRNTGLLNLTTTTVDGNIAEGNGGGVYSNAVPTSSTLVGAITATDSSVTLASATGFPVQPGFLVVIDTEVLEVTSVSGNVLGVVRAANGTAATVHSAGAIVTLVQVAVTDSVISNNDAAFGAGLFNDDGAIVISGGSLQGNVAGVDGGAFYNDRNSTVVLIGTTVTQNSAGRDGGGLYNNDIATAQVSGSTISSNTAARNGGGLFNETTAKLLIQNTRVSANAAVDGAGIYNEDGTLTITSGSILANTAGNLGGAIFATSAATTSLTDTTVGGNISGDDGGAFYNEGTLNLTGVAARGNSARGDGGVISNIGRVTLTNVTFAGNDADGSGGAIHNRSVGTLTITDSDFLNNLADVDGGAIANISSGRLVLTATTLDSNRAGRRGGGLMHSASIVATIGSSTLSFNDAQTGGGIYAAGRLNVSNSTISGNSATVSGGGLWNQSTTSVQSTTIVNNTATTSGGGIFNSSVLAPLTLKNTIVARNTSPSGADIIGTGFVNGGNNLIGTTGSGGTRITTFDTGGNIIGTTGAEVDPLLGTLQDNGGATFTHSLLFGSPARDAGNNVGVSATDQRGFDRIFDGDGDGTGTIDIGSFESGLTVNSFLDTVDAKPGDRASADINGNSTLRAAIMEANALPGANSIVLLPGTYRLTIAGRGENDTVMGDLDVTDTLTIIGAGVGQTIIDASGLDRVFEVLAGATLNLMNLTVRGGRADDGGGILNRGVLNLQNVEITANTADFGGGIYNDITVGSLAATMNATTTTLLLTGANNFPRQTGYVLLVDGEQMRVDAINGSTLTVTRGFGGTGAIAHSTGARVEVFAASVVNLLNTSVTLNQAFLNGGGIFNNDELVITLSDVSRNTAGIRGGGLYNTELATIDQSTFDRNVSQSKGGAIYNEGTTTGIASEITITTSTISNNFAGALGGAIYNSDRMSVDNSTISGNSTGGEAGAIYNTGIPQQQTIVATPASVTVVLDFIEAFQLPLVDPFGIAMSPFDVTAFGFNASDFDLVTSAIVDQVRDHYHGIVTNDVDSRSPIPAGQQLDIDFVIGDVGTPPSNGATEYFYFLVGAAQTPTSLGVAFTSSVRNANGAGPNFGFQVGDIVGSNYSNEIQALGGLNPANALSSGDLFFTVNAMSGTMSHEIGHTLSLLHLNAAGAVTPNNLPPIMGTGAIDLPNQARIGEREFALSGINSQAGGQTQMHIQQLVDALGLRAAPITLQTPGVGFLNLTNTTIVNNAADRIGGGVLNKTGSTVEVRNSIIASNNAQSADNDVSGQFESRNTNFIGDAGSSFGFVNGFKGDQVGSALSPLDPVFDVLASNGGPTQTHALLDGSPAIDAGDNAGGTPTDQRGASKPTDNTADIGAFEVQDNSISITDVSKAEGQGGSTLFEFTVLLGSAASEPITVQYATVQDTALGGSDFLPVSGTLSFAPGELTKTIVVEVFGDTDPEPTEQFFVELFNAVNTTISDDQAVGTIVNDDAFVSIDDVAVLEGDSTGSATANFTVTLSAPLLEDVTVTYSTANGTATGGTGSGDYNIISSGSLTFAAGETTKTITVTINGDTTPEAFETFFVNLGTALTAGGQSLVITDGQGLGTIQNDDISLSLTNVTPNPVTEGTGSNTPVSYRVTLAQPVGVPVTVRVSTVDGTATGGADFTAQNSVLVTIPANTLFVTRTVTVIGDSVFEEFPETFSLRLDAGSATLNGVAEPGAVLGGPVTITINDDEPRPTRFVTFINGSGNIQVDRQDFNNGTMTYEFTSTLVNTNNFTNAITINGQAALDDQFIFDFVNGNPLPVNGVNISGNTQIAGDSMQLINGAATNVVYTATGTGPAHSGTVNVDGRVISYTGLEPITDTLTAQNRTFTLDASLTGDQAIRVINAGGRTLIDSNGANAFESVEFTNPTNSLTVNGNAGHNTITVGPLAGSFSATLTINGADGNDRIDTTATNVNLTVDGGLGSDVISTGGGDDSIIGGGGTDSITAGDGNDTVDGGDGNDTIRGGAGNDSLLGGLNNDQIFGEAGNDVVNGGDGDDTVDGGADNDILDGGAGLDLVNGGAGQDVARGGVGNDTVNGGDGNDTVEGGDGNDVVSGNAGNDAVRGNEGNDTLAGGAGTDNLTGGDGIDLISETATGNESMILTDTTLTVGGLSDSHSLVEQFILTGGDLATLIDATAYTQGSVTMFGGAGNDTLLGSSGNDRIEGGDGSDSINGNAGNDTINGGKGADVIHGGDGNDSLNGQADADTIFGDAGIDVLLGGGDNDSLDGGTGNDTIRGNSGNDVIVGGGGNDNAWGDFGADTISGGDGNDTLRGSAGNDQLLGDAGDDRLVGQDGDDRVDGGIGDDTSVGGSGNDTLIAGDGRDELNGSGGSADVVILPGLPGTEEFMVKREFGQLRITRTNTVFFVARPRNTEIIQLDLAGGNDTFTVQNLNGITGSARFDINLGSGANSLDASANLNPNFTFNVLGGSDSDSIMGGAGNDTLNGGAGDDSIFAQAGNDSLIGGAGNDTLDGDAGDDIIDGGIGNDTIFGGTGFDTISGGDGDDSIQGDGNADVIDGGAGNDTIRGDGGSDTINGGAGNDKINGGLENDRIDGDAGNDTLVGEDGEDFISGGDGADIISGGAGNDRLSGNDGRDVLMGDAGDDSLYGGGKEDILVGGLGGDTLNGQGTTRDTVVGETALDGTADDTPDPNDLFLDPNEARNAFVLSQLILDSLNF